MATNAGAMTREHDPDTGRIIQSYPLEKFHAAVAELDMAGTRDVADHVGCSYQLAYKRLRELEDQGRVESLKIGGSRVWSVVDQEDDE